MEKPATTKRVQRPQLEHPMKYYEHITATAFLAYVKNEFKKIPPDKGRIERLSRDFNTVLDLLASLENESGE